MRTIPQFPEHSISEDGKTITNLKGRVIKQGPQIIKGKITGYLYATMLASDYSYTKRVAVHRLVAFAWLPDPPTLSHVWINHKDGNKANNHASNLEWTTISQNIQHAHDTGLKRTPKGADHWRYGKTATAETRRKMSNSKRGKNHPGWKGYYFANFKRFDSAPEAAKHIGVTPKTIIARCHNKKFRLKGYYFLPENTVKP